MVRNILVNMKKIIKVVSSIFESSDIEFDYQKYKKIAYGELEVSDDNYRKLKNSFDGLMFVLNNKNTALEPIFLNKLFCILEIKISVERILEIISTLSVLSFYDMLAKILIEINSVDNDIMTFSLSVILFEYFYYKRKESILKLNSYSLKEMKNLIENKYNEDLIKYIKNVENRMRIIDEEYYNSLAETHLDDIIYRLKKDQNFIVENYKIDKIFIFGSFASSCERIDSDIDIAVILKKGQTYNEKLEKVNEFKNYILKTFKRRGDVLELNGLKEEELENTIEVF